MSVQPIPSPAEALLEQLLAATAAAEDALAAGRPAEGLARLEAREPLLEQLAAAVAGEPAPRGRLAALLREMRGRDESLAERLRMEMAIVGERLARLRSGHRTEPTAPAAIDLSV